MTKRFDVCGLGSAIVDVMYQVSEADFGRTGYTKESYGIIDQAENSKLLANFSHLEQLLASGGSVANSMIALAQLGSKAAFVCVTGADQFGKHYQAEFRELGIEVGASEIHDGSTSSAFVLITPDAKRTMRWFLGVAPQFGASHVNASLIQSSRWLFIEGYLFLLGANAHAAINLAIAEAKKGGTKIALTLSDSMVINQQRAAIEAVLPSVDLLFANEHEAPAISNTKSPDEAFTALQKRFSSLVVTAGSRGAFIWHEGSSKLVPAFPCTPVDLTGAGDMFAGAFLHGLCAGMPAGEAARGANYLSREVITRVGPRLGNGTRRYWDEANSDPSRAVHA